MFKYTIVIAVLAVSASLASNIPTASGIAASQQEPSVSSTNILAHKMTHKPQKIVYMPTVHEEHGLLDSGVFGLLESLSISKKMVGGAVGYFIGKLNVKKILNVALVGALITVLGTVAVMAVSGLVSLVSGICAMAPYFKFFFGHGDVPETHIDTISDFVLDSFNKYDQHYKA